MAVVAWIALLFIPVLVFLSAYLHFRFVSSKYWCKRKIPHLPPLFLLGNLWRANVTDHLVLIIKRWYLENKDKKLLGFWMYTRPFLLVLDLELTKRMLIKDFNVFRDRGFEVDPELNPLSRHLFLLNGKEWRNLRVKLTPTFTSGKMKMMFPAMVKCGDELTSHLKAFAEGKDPVEVKDLMARFTTDVISSCAFGLETNSIRNPKAEFREFGKRVFQPDLRTATLNILRGISPRLLKILKLPAIKREVTDFFINAVRETVEYRQKNNVSRNDFLQLLIQLMRAGKIEDVDKTDVNGMTDEELVTKFSLRDATAQCFVFFFAGFETSSTALTFGLYELALNPDIQSKVQKEIDDMLEKTNNEITYEGVCDLEYLDKVVQEILRKYPPGGLLQRKCAKDYYIPELDVTIDEGTTLFFQVMGFHHDPDFYPEPDKFDPERFSHEEKSKRDPITYLPFGEGPRNCIGNRFGLLQMKVALISIFREYSVEVCKTTPIPLVFHNRGFILHPLGGMPLVFTKRF